MKDELIVLGTGNALAKELYNTCFALRGEQGLLLVDTGGGNGILRQMDRAGIALDDIHDIILTHQHTDHLLGVFWLIRLINQHSWRGGWTGRCRIYCHAELADILSRSVELLLEEKLRKGMGDFIHIIPVEDGACVNICGYPVTFFDLGSTKVRQFGFTAILSNGQKLTCLGDEPFRPINAARLQNCDWLLCEAFCLYREADIFKPYEKHHSTVREACEVARQYQIPHLVLWHTEESHGCERKRLYTEEGREFYSGDLHVPDDLEVVSLCE